MRILIIDDEPDSAESLLLNLEHVGYQVDWAPDAATASGLCRTHDYGVLFLDLHLPDRSGLDLLPDLQKLCPEGEIVVLTGDPSLQNAARAVNDGANFYLPKPIDVARVLPLVRRAEEDRRQRLQLNFQGLVLENVRDAVVALDLEKRVTYWNHGAEDLYGWSAPEMLGQPIDRLLGAGEDIIEGVPADGSARVRQANRLRRDGSLAPVEERVHTLRDPVGRTVGYLTLARDVTERNEVERERERLRRREHTIAVTFQQALMPEIPSQRPGLVIGQDYAPAWKDADVGGDFYDVLSLPGGRTALLVGDVSGKGLSAAVLMALISHVINAYADVDERPNEVLERTNRHLAPRIPEERFVTLFYATYDPAEHRLTYASAGHEPGIICRADGSIHLLGSTGPMLGVDPKMEFGCDEVELHAGDVLLIYTDGASEAGAPFNCLGTDRLVDLFKERCHLPVQQIIEEIREAAIAWSGGHLLDDLAMLCVRAVDNSA
jgi:PAS domain S-box-containing protein